MQNEKLRESKEGGCVSEASMLDSLRKSSMFFLSTAAT